MSLIGVGVGIVGDYVVGKAVDVLSSTFKSGVIDRWSRRRAEEFVRTFCDLVCAGKSDEEIEPYLNAIVQDDAKSAALFDAYRRVALSASPVLGPRIIAIITARLVGEKRVPNYDEEKLLAAGERLNDAELIEARNWFNSYVVKLEQKDGSYFDEGWPDTTGGIELWDGWGPWAAKLSLIGFIFQSIRPIPKFDLTDDEESYRTSQKVKDVGMATDMIYNSAYKELAELITRAEGMTPAA